MKEAFSLFWKKVEFKNMVCINKYTETATNPESKKCAPTFQMSAKGVSHISM